MRYIISLLLIVTACAFPTGCNKNPSGQAEVQKKDSITVNSLSEVEQEGRNNKVWQESMAMIDTAVLIEPIISRATIAFTNESDLLDSFELIIQPGKIRESITTLTIKDYTGLLIYSDTFLSVKMINGYHMMQREDFPSPYEYILNRSKFFFSADAFRVAREDSLIIAAELEDFSDYEAWLEAQRFTNALKYFVYCLGEEDCRYIIYSDSKKKAVVFYTCC